MVGSLGWTELLLISAVVVIFLGKGNQLPEITRALGEAVREFKDAANPNGKQTRKNHPEEPEIEDNETRDENDTTN